jgi:hypothetical protein
LPRARSKIQSATPDALSRSPGDELNVADIIRTFKTVTGHKPWVAPIPAFAAKKMIPKEFADMFRWIREEGFEANIAQVRQEYPQLLTFAGWLKKYTDEH